MSVNGTLVEDKMRRFKGKCTHFSFNKCPIYTHDRTSTKFSTNSHETDNSVGLHSLSQLAQGIRSTEGRKAICAEQKEYMEKVKNHACE